MRLCARLLAALLIALASAAAILVLAPLVAVAVAIRVVLDSVDDLRPAASSPPADAFVRRGTGRNPLPAAGEEMRSI